MRILLIDDELHRARAIVGILPMGTICVWAPNGYVGEAELGKEKWGALLLDHDLYCKSGKSGLDMAMRAIETQDPCPVFIHSQNKDGAEAMRRVLSDKGFKVTVSPWINERGTAEGLKEWLQRETQCPTIPQVA
jgi:hypothetical protein